MSRLLSTKDVAEKLGVYINTVRAIQKMVGLKESKQRVKKDIFKDEVMVFYKWAQPINSLTYKNLI